MRILNLFIRNFRNYPEAFIEFSPHLNEFYGHNGQGKTNLLEALYLAMTGRPWRSSRLADCIFSEREGFFLQVNFLKKEVPQSLSIRYAPREKKIVHNTTSHASFAHLLGLIQGVLFAPSDQVLIHGSASFRRRFLDLHLSQCHTQYLYHLNRYHRALKQRNALLRHKVEKTFEVWENEMATSAAHLIQARLSLIEKLAPQATAHQQMLSQQYDHLAMRYLSSLPLEGDIATSCRLAWEKNRTKDLTLGYTSLGPHRDDLLLTINELEARRYASEGQMRCCAMSLRLAEWEHLHEVSGEPPIQLVDDVGPNLDPQRREALYQALQGKGQTFLTAPIPLGSEKQINHKVFTISSGQVFLPE